MPVGKDITSIKEQGRNVPGKWVVKKMAVLCIMGGLEGWVMEERI